jgi:transposase
MKSLVFGVNVRSIFRWLTSLANRGQTALLAKPISNLPPKVREEEMRWLARAVRENTPQQYKFAFGLWVLLLIAALIEREFGKKLAIASVSRIMNLLGFSAQKPLPVLATVRHAGPDLGERDLPGDPC